MAGRPHAPPLPTAIDDLTDRPPHHGVDDAEIAYHIAMIKYYFPGVIVDIIWMRVAMLSQELWALVAMTVPWLGRYTLLPNVSFRIGYYFAARRRSYPRATRRNEVALNHYVRHLPPKYYEHGLQITLKTKIDSEPIGFHTAAKEFPDVVRRSIRVEFKLWDRGRTVSLVDCPCEVTYENGAYDFHGFKGDVSAEKSTEGALALARSIERGILDGSILIDPCHPPPLTMRRYRVMKAAENLDSYASARQRLLDSVEQSERYIRDLKREISVLDFEREQYLRLSPQAKKARSELPDYSSD